MAPNQKAVELQTDKVIQYLLQDDVPGAYFRCQTCSLSDVEADGPTGSEDDFDPAPVAEKLRSIADSLNDNVAFKEALDKLKKEAALGAIEKAFDSSVKALCQTKVLECPEVSQEMCLLKISAAFGHLAVKSCPNLRRQISHAMNEFITRNLGGWITEQGGWEGINI